jgi:deoxycytidylate deaminase
MDYFWLMGKAIEAAKKSTYKVKMGAVIFKGKRVISIGCNHPLKSAKHLHPRFQKWHGSIHAEVSAVLKAKTDLRRCNILVVRVNRFGDIRTSKPCDWCLRYLQVVGIRKIYHTVHNTRKLDFSSIGGFNYYLEEISL